MEGQEETCRNKIDSICSQYEASSIAQNVIKSQLPAVKSNAEIENEIKKNVQNGVGFFVSFWWLLWRSLIAQVP